MAKLTLTDITNIGGNPTQAQGAINTNSERIEVAMEKTLSRDGTQPNQMEADFDMNNNDILNAQHIYTDELFVNDTPVTPTPGIKPDWNADPSANNGILNRPTVGLAPGNLVALGTDGYFPDSVVGFQQSNSDIKKPAILKLREQVSAFDRMIPSLAEAIQNSEITSSDSTEISSAINELISDFSTRGGSLFLPSGFYYVQAITAADKLRLIGENFGSVILQAPDGVDGQLIYTPGQLTNTPVNFLSLENIIFDGNKDNALRAVAASAVAINGFHYLTIKNCVFRNATGYGLGLQSHLGASINAPQTECYLENLYFDDNGIGTGGVGADTFDGLDIKYCDTITGVHLHARNNEDRGINIRALRLSLFGCSATGNGFNSPQGLTAGIELVGNPDGAGGQVPTTMRLVSCESRDNAGAGFSFSNGSGSGTRLTRVDAAACMAFGNGSHGLEVAGTSNTVELGVHGGNFSENTGSGISLSQTVKFALIDSPICRLNGASGLITSALKSQINGGVYCDNTTYGIEETATATRTAVTGPARLSGNGTANWLFNSNRRYYIAPSVIDYDIGVTGGDIIASASTITLPEGGSAFTITGTTTITGISPSFRNRIVTLMFTGILTVTHGSALRLNGGTNKTTANHNTLTLVYDGTSWAEVSFSATT